MIIFFKINVTGVLDSIEHNKAHSAKSQPINFTIKNEN
jgi:hypothetical protein